MSARLARRARQVSQVVFFLAALALLFSALPGRPAFPLADLFFRFNPLSGLMAMISARAWIPRLGLGLLTMGATLLLGRVWCGWICPTGSLVEWVRFPGAGKRQADASTRQARISPRWRAGKYLLLAAALISALLGSLALLSLDPLALFTRAFSAALLPGLDQIVTGFERLVYPLRPYSPLVDWLETALRGTLLPAKPHAYAGSAWILLLLAGILALNALAERFWCRYLCPLGGLLGLFSRFALLRPAVGPACRGCGKCARSCPMAAIQPAEPGEPSEPYRVVSSECVMCLDCLVDCPKQDMALKPVLPPLPSPAEPLLAPSPGRRTALGTMAAAAAGVVLAQSGLEARLPDPTLIRPPGAQDEAAFLARCLRCSQCIRACPTGGLQPSLLEAGLEGLFTPRLASRLGACDYACTACGQVCPSGAIPLLELAAKRETLIGLAAIDRGRCLPWAYDTPCIVCEEMCPRPTKAVRLEEVLVKGPDGGELTLQRPYILRELCIGCGICENQCPLASQAAVRVFRRA